MAQRDFWVHPIISDHWFKGEYHTLYPDLREYPEKFFRRYRMSIQQFDYLLQLLWPHLEKLNNKFRASINAEQRLVVTLRECLFTWYYIKFLNQIRVSLACGTYLMLIFTARKYCMQYQFDVNFHGKKILQQYQFDIMCHGSFCTYKEPTWHFWPS